MARLARIVIHDGQSTKAPAIEQCLGHAPIRQFDPHTVIVKPPKLGRPGIISGTHELIPHESYRLVYEIEQDTVWVLALVHTAKQRPPLQE